MKRVVAALLSPVIIVVFFFSCSKKTETYPSESIGSYYPLLVGKTYLYRLDSTVPAAFGTALIVKSYQAKDSIESTFTDNSGRLSYRIFRYTRDTLATQPWSFAATYVATPTPNSLEYVDNNLRFIKLVLPITEDYTWPAHTYINTQSINTTVGYLDGWDYNYQNVDQPYSVLGKNFDSTITVFQRDEFLPAGPFNPNYDRQDRNYGIEVYAKGVGMIYKEFLHWTWQKNPVPSFEESSYGVKLQLISYK